MITHSIRIQSLNNVCVCRVKQIDIWTEIRKKFEETDTDIPEDIKIDVLTTLEHWLVC